MTSEAARQRVMVIVLGPIEQSPRMRYHVRALLDAGCSVELVCWDGDRLPDELASDSNLRGWRVGSPGAAWRRRLPRPLFAVVSGVRLVHHAVELARVMDRLGPGNSVWLQTPPALPTLPVVLAAARLKNLRVVVDWHNFGDAMLALRLGRDHALVHLAGVMEGWLGTRADAHLCVSNAMQSALRERWGIPATVLHDHPARDFRTVSVEEAHPLFKRLFPDGPGDRSLLTDCTPGGDVAWRPDRPALLVCPTSWTDDEQMDLLLDALPRLDAPDLPRMMVVITGRGPRREAFERRLRQWSGRRVTVETMFLPHADYARLLGAADVGLCFHRSASGVDLPMKVADMLGAGLPVCALDYGDTLREQLGCEERGALFRDSDGLVAELRRLLHGFGTGDAALDAVKAALRRNPRRRWDEAWREVAAPLLGLGRVP